MSGARLGTLDGPTFVRPGLIAVAKPAPEPVGAALAAAALAAIGVRKRLAKS